ncbi:unnamed protein product [Clavelina lepadiformis]|uniref:Uncharacterized protein n=1 Tax=Clavelina lepadiformis TaxID=159417 RepID=A0ABP0FN17_CLALP
MSRVRELKSSYRNDMSFESRSKRRKLDIDAATIQKVFEERVVMKNDYEPMTRVYQAYLLAKARNGSYYDVPRLEDLENGRLQQSASAGEAGGINCEARGTNATNTKLSIVIFYGRNEKNATSFTKVQQEIEIKKHLNKETHDIIS